MVADQIFVHINMWIECAGIYGMQQLMQWHMRAYIVKGTKKTHRIVVTTLTWYLTVRLAIESIRHKVDRCTSEWREIKYNDWDVLL